MIRTGLLAAAVALSSSAWAEGMAVTPGKWEMSSTVGMPMLGEPRTMTSEQCIRESEFTPETFNEQSTPGDCQFEVQEISSSSMSWTMVCQTPGGTSQGQFSAESSGDELSGQGTMSMKLGEQEMEVTMEWAGKRIGDC